MELVKAEWMTPARPDDRVLRELLSYDAMCKEAVQFAWDPQENIVGFINAPPIFHWSRTREWPWALQAVQLPTCARVLDAGGGHGVFQYALAKRVPHGTVTNADWNAESFKIVQQHPLGERIHLQHADLTKLPTADDKYDAVYCISVLEHIPNQTAALRELCRVLRPGGHLILTMDVQIMKDTVRRGLLFEDRLLDVLRFFNPKLTFDWLATLGAEMSLGRVPGVDQYVGVFLSVWRK